jgi:spermidine synthase
MSSTVETPPISLHDGAAAVRSGPDPQSSDHRIGQLPFAVAIFLSAFLLFQVQLLLGKEILPIFGGAPAVWTVCILIFQLLFLAGYGYAHLLAITLPVRKQVVVHGALLGASAIFLAVQGYMRSAPLGPGAGWRPQPGANPTWTIALFLIGSIGPPFFLLSATSPSMQYWLSQAVTKRSPYRLYALSNVGSLLGLLSYPLLIEPHLRLVAQGWMWAAGYGLFLICYYFGARSVARTAPLAAPRQTPLGHRASRAAPVAWSLRLFWVGVAACASVLLLATTNLISEDVAVSPFLWVLELSLYLLSFIICFENDRWYRREIFYPLFTVSVVLVILVSLPNVESSFVTQLVAYSAVLFSGCMVCHGEAARTRPNPESLTVFYFSIATGGAIGGLVVSLLAPAIFPNYWEYPLGVLGCMAILLSVSQREPSSWWFTGRASLALLIFAGAVLLAPRILAPVWKEAARLPRSIAIGAGMAFLGAAVFRYASERRASKTTPAPRLVRSASRIVLALLAAGLMIPQKAALYHVIASSRNFYGVLSVLSVDKDNYLALRYGNTIHGFQYQDPQRAHVATGYYGRGSGANLAIRSWPQHPLRVGLVGMGVGTLAALAQAGDVYRFYEINPDVYKLSSGQHPYFTFLRDSPGKVEVVLGDARLSLEREASRGDFQKFDVLVLDAFSSDAIPMHLLTRQAFSIYEQHLRGQQSIIAVHISNQTLDLRPVLEGISREFSFHTVRVYPLLPTGPFSQSDWLLLSRDPASLARPEIAQYAEVALPQMPPIYWTDDYCDLFRVIRWRD